LIPFLLHPVSLAQAGDNPPERLLFDFERVADIKAWSNLMLPGAKTREPEVRLELVAEHATAGAHSLKLTYACGTWPTVTTAAVHGDWLPYQTFHADVTVGRACVVGFTALLEKSERGEGWEALVSRWTTTAFLRSGTNHVVAAIPQPNEYGISRKRGKVIRFEIFMYQPHQDESIYIDNVRLTTKKETPPPANVVFKVAGTDWTLNGRNSSGVSSAQAVIELGNKLKDRWIRPEPRSVAEHEAELRALYARLKEKHPRAVLAVLRDGEKGYDPARPDQVFAGWKDAYFNSHGPDSNYAERARNHGSAASHEVFMRHRSPLMRVDLSSIPPGSAILAARLLIVRANDKVQDDHDPQRKPTMWVVEPCNRPWDEQRVNAFEYAPDRFWHAVGGMDWGADPDFRPIFLAHGPGQGKVNAWDFTEAVRFWIGGKHANHGFMLHGDSHDYMIAHSREAKNQADRPAVLVIYEPAR
jgi:hypothetical protein